MIVSIHQSEYLPWMGFFDKLTRCDVFVVFDVVQFERNSFQNRNKIRTKDGWSWLTVPIVHDFPQTINNVKISGDKWKTDHLKTLECNYRRTPYFDYYFPFFKKAFSYEWDSISKLNTYLINLIKDLLGIKVKIVYASDFYNGTGKNEKLISVCKSVGADTYLSGIGGRCYVDEKMFNDSGIKVLWHEYDHPEYKQKFDGFEPCMSVLDLLFNEGPNAKDILMKGGGIIESISHRSPSR